MEILKCFYIFPRQKSPKNNFIYLSETFLCALASQKASVTLNLKIILSFFSHLVIIFYSQPSFAFIFRKIFIPFTAIVSHFFFRKNCKYPKNVPLPT